MKKFFVFLTLLFLTPAMVLANGKVGSNVVLKDLNVRSVARFGENRIGYLKKGQVVTVKKVSGSWCQIDYKKYKNAYIVCSLLNPTNVSDSNLSLNSQANAQLNCESLKSKKADNVRFTICEGLKKLGKANSLHFDFSIQANLQDAKASKFDSKFSLIGDIDVHSAKEPKMSALIETKMVDDKINELNAKAEVKFNKDTFYAYVRELSGKGNVDISPETKNLLVGKWWKFTLPASVLKDLALQASDSKVLAKQNKFRALFQNSQVFKDIKYVNTEEVLGEQSNQYSFTIDTKSVKDLLIATNELQGMALNKSEADELDKNLKTFEFYGNISVGKVSGVANKFILIMKATKSNKEMSGKIIFTLSFGSFDKPVKVEVPASSTEVPLGSMFDFPNQ